MAEPRPSQKFLESVNAPGGKLKARAALKWVNPAKIIQPIVPITPNHRNFERKPMSVIRRYSNKTAMSTLPIAMKVVPAAAQ